MSSFSDFLASVDSEVAGAILVAVVAGALSALGWLSLSVIDTLARRKARLGAEQDKARHLKEVLVDVLIDADFIHESISEITDPTRIADVKDKIDKDKAYQAYVVSVHTDPTFEEYRGVRRQLDIPLMAACDRYFDLSQLFSKYYDALGDPTFGALDQDRKKAVIDELCRIGAQTQDTYHNLRNEMARSSKSRPVYRQVVDFLESREKNADATSPVDPAEQNKGKNTLGVGAPRPNPPKATPPVPQPPKPRVPVAKPLQPLKPGKK